MGVGGGGGGWQEVCVCWMVSCAEIQIRCKLPFSGFPHYHDSDRKCRMHWIVDCFLPRVSPLRLQRKRKTTGTNNDFHLLYINTFKVIIVLKDARIEHQLWWTLCGRNVFSSFNHSPQLVFLERVEKLVEPTAVCCSSLAVGDICLFEAGGESVRSSPRGLHSYIEHKLWIWTWRRTDRKTSLTSPCNLLDVFILWLFCNLMNWIWR